MHEASIAQSIIDQMSDKLASGEIRGKITRVSVLVGKLTAVIPENLIFMYDVLTGDTPVAGSMLEVELVPVICRCRACDNDFEASNLEFWCPKCTTTNITIIKGRELMIASIEVDDGNPTN